MSKDALEAILHLGETKFDLKREVADLEDRKGSLNKDLIQLKKDKSNALSIEEQDFKSRVNTFNKECTAREKVLTQKESDIEKRLEASAVIESEENKLRNMKKLFAEERKELDVIKSLTLEKDHLADLKQEQLDTALRDANLSPEEIEAKAKKNKKKKEDK